MRHALAAVIVLELLEGDRAQPGLRPSGAGKSGFLDRRR